jgi:hypothetical protein
MGISAVERAVSTCRGLRDGWVVARMMVLGCRVDLAIAVVPTADLK